MTSNLLRLDLGAGDALDVRTFTVEEGLSRLFEVHLTAVCPSADVDFEAAIGGPARFTIETGGEGRFWSGIAARVAQIRADEQGLSTYDVRLVPSLWLLGQTSNYRIFQDKSELDIVLEVLAAWGIEPALDLDAGSYKKRRQRTQYGESDLAFVSRLLEDAGVAYHFDQRGGETKLVLADALCRGASRAAVPFLDKPNPGLSPEHVTKVRSRREVRPGRATQSDVDYRKPLLFPLSASASAGTAVEARLESYTHDYGSFLWKGGGGGDTPFADDRGAARTDQRAGGDQVARRLDAQRSEARRVTFATTAHDLRPGQVFTIADHPRRELGAPLLVAQSTFSGKVGEEWIHTGEARYTDVDYRPPHVTPRPMTRGVESATVTGPAGEEIHTDEFGRVRVKFHWDREGAADETSSAWVPVSQPWAGAGFGAINLPRVGQEVIVDFLGADPDRPLVMGRVFTTTTPPPYQLPKYKSVSGLRSQTYPSSAPGGGGRMGGGPLSDSIAVAAHDSAPRGGPIGGGVEATGLGTGPEPRSLGAQPGSVQSMPGIFGGTQAQPPELQQAVQQMRSAGPDAGDPQRDQSGIVSEDADGRQNLGIQAQRDLALIAKNDLLGTVGGNRGFWINGNDTEEIEEGWQAVKVAYDRTIEVGKKLANAVKKDVVSDGKQNRITRTKNDYFSQATDGAHAFMAQKNIIFRADNRATIVMTPSAIIFNAESVYLTPGESMLRAVYHGANLQQGEEAQRSEERIRAATERLVRTFERYRGDRPNARPVGQLLQDAGNGDRDLQHLREEALRSGAGNPEEANEALRRAGRRLSE